MPPIDKEMKGKIWIDGAHFEPARLFLSSPLRSACGEIFKDSDQNQDGWISFEEAGRGKHRFLGMALEARYWRCGKFYLAGSVAEATRIRDRERRDVNRMEGELKRWKWLFPNGALAMVAGLILSVAALSGLHWHYSMPIKDLLIVFPLATGVVALETAFLYTLLYRLPRTFTLMKQLDQIRERFVVTGS